VAGFTGGAWVLGPSLRAGYDFVRGTQVEAHIVDRSLTPLPVAQNGAHLWPLLGVYFATYWLAYAAYEMLIERPHVRLAVLVFLCGAAAMLFLPFLPTSDPYAYALYGVEAGPLGLSPYVAQSALGESPWGATLLGIFPSMDSYVRVCNYGPVFAFAYGGLALALERVPLGTFLIAERVLGLAALLVAALGLAFAETGENAVERWKRAATFAFHPLVLFEFVAFAHGDVIMLALLAWAYVAFRRDRFALAGGLCALAAGTRVVALLAIVALGVAAIRRGPAAFGRAALGAALASGVVGLASYVRFGTVSLGGPPVFGPYSSPWLAAGSLLGLEEPWTTRMLAVELLAGAAIAAVLCYRALRTGLLRLLAWLPFAALVATPTVYSHYVTWFTTLRSISGDRAVLRIARALSFTAPVLYVTHLDPFPFPGASPPVQCAVLALFWLPVLVAGLIGLRQIRAEKRARAALEVRY
jgi:hypothetical protein